MSAVVGTEDVQSQNRVSVVSFFGWFGCHTAGDHKEADNNQSMVSECEMLMIWKANLLPPLFSLGILV